MNTENTAANTAANENEVDVEIDAPEVDVEAPEASETEPTAEDRIAELEAQLHEAREDRLRAIAEADNTRKRTQRELDNARKFAVEPLAKELLSMADNMKRALEAVDPAKAETDVDLKNLRAAVEVMDKELLAAFQKNGINLIDPQGEAFDPNTQQAMFEVPTGDVAPGTVMQVVTRGYQLHERLLRPAMVGVAKAAG